MCGDDGHSSSASSADLMSSDSASDSRRERMDYFLDSMGGGPPQTINPLYRVWRVRYMTTTRFERFRRMLGHGKLLKFEEKDPLYYKVLNTGR